MIATDFRTILDALLAAPPRSEFVTSWIGEDERETVDFGEFRRRASIQAVLLREHGVAIGDRVIIIMPQGIPAMTVFVGAMMLGAVPAILAYPNFKVEAGKYRFGLAGVTANLNARAVVIDEQFPDDMLDYVALGDNTELVRASDVSGAASAMDFPVYECEPESLAFLQHSAGTTG